MKMRLITCGFILAASFASSVIAQTADQKLAADKAKVAQLQTAVTNEKKALQGLLATETNLNNQDHNTKAAISRMTADIHYKEGLIAMLLKDEALQKATISCNAAHHAYNQMLVERKSGVVQHNEQLRQEVFLKEEEKALADTKDDADMQAFTKTQIAKHTALAAAAKSKSEAYMKNAATEEALARAAYTEANKLKANSCAILLPQPPATPTPRPMPPTTKPTPAATPPAAAAPAKPAAALASFSGKGKVGCTDRACWQEAVQASVNACKASGCKDCSVSQSASDSCKFENGYTCTSMCKTAGK